jgi:hypothetical protein
MLPTVTETLAVPGVAPVAGDTLSHDALALGVAVHVSGAPVLAIDNV